MAVKLLIQTSPGGDGIGQVIREINGLMTYDRQPKFDVNAIREINQMVQ